MAEISTEHLIKRDFEALLKGLPEQRRHTPAVQLDVTDTQTSTSRCPVNWRRGRVAITRFPDAVAIFGLMDHVGDNSSPHPGQRLSHPPSGKTETGETVYERRLPGLGVLGTFVDVSFVRRAILR